MFSSLRINAICALIPCEETKNSAFVFFRVCAHVVEVFTKSYTSVHVASRISPNCAQYFTVFESFIWFTQVVGLQRKQHTGTEDKSILLKLVSVVHLFEK